MTDGELDRRIAERQAADARYNAALTEVDRALPRLAPPPVRAAGPETAPPLRAAAATVGATPASAPGWRGRLARFVWRIVAPAFERQQAFNLAVASELERGDAARRESRRAVDEWCEAARAQLEAFSAFDSRLIQYLQQITPFVDSKVRVLEESLVELRMAATAAQRSAVAARRELERLGRGGPAPAVAVSGSAQASVPRPAGAPGAGYVGFEDLFRGSSAEIRARQREYADRFAGASDVLDVGCGRGEFLDMLRERGIPARGIEANAEMAEVCRARGLDVRDGDALSYLAGLPDDSLGGLLAAQVVEHLEPEYLVQVIEVAHAKLRPGALIVLETINAACWVAFFESYIRDITHVRPLHPDTLKFLVVAAGFEGVDVHFRSPVADEGRLQTVSLDGVSGELRDIAIAFNRNVERLNDRLFTHLDYAVIGAKGR